MDSWKYNGKWIRPDSEQHKPEPKAQKRKRKT